MGHRAAVFLSVRHLSVSVNQLDDVNKVGNNNYSQLTLYPI